MTMKNPKYYEYMKPALFYLKDGIRKKRKEIYLSLADYLNLDAEARQEKYSTGETYFESRISWALTYLKKAGLINQPERSIFEISSKGLDVIKENPKEINKQYLMKFDNFRQFSMSKNSKQKIENDIIENDDFTPEDNIESSVEQYKKNISIELLNKIHENSPEFLEKLVLNLLWKMGYGEAEEDLIHTGKTNDKGIDGIVYEDKLGLSKIFVQVKRYDLMKTIDRPTIQQFVGAIPKGFNKGIFVTTSKFGKPAEEFALTANIVLIDGDKLAKLMYDYKIGLQTKSVLYINQIDYDFFEE